MVVCHARAHYEAGTYFTGPLLHIPLLRWLLLLILLAVPSPLLLQLQITHSVMLMLLQGLFQQLLLCLHYLLFSQPIQLLLLLPDFLRTKDRLCWCNLRLLFLLLYYFLGPLLSLMRSSAALPLLL
jgi:hypothetical protein